MSDPRTVALQFRVPQDHPGATLTGFLAERFTYHTEDAWRAHVDDGKVDIDGQLADRFSSVRAGARIAYRPALDDIEVTIVHREDDLVVVDKPAGSVCHRLSAFGSRTFVRGLELRVGGPLEFAHRLDRGTRGLVVLARGARLAQVVAAFRDGGVDKQYRASVVGHVVRDRFTLDGSLGRDVASGVPGRFCIDPNGKLATTQCRVLRRDADSTELAVFPITGRTHQIRVHLSAIGHPILGDALYAADWREAYPREIAAMRSGSVVAHALAHVRMALHLDGERREWSLPGVEFDEPA